MRLGRRDFAGDNEVRESKRSERRGLQPVEDIAQSSSQQGRSVKDVVKPGVYV